MLRIGLSLVLTLVVGLPHGLCFCHYVDAAAVPVETTCCDGESPTETPDAPDDDADCSCKLREPLASSPTSPSVDRGDSVEVLATLQPAIDFGFCGTPCPDRSAGVRAHSISLRLILCALRI